MGVKRRTFLRLGGLVVATAAVADLDLLGLGKIPAAAADPAPSPARGLFGGPTTLDQTIIPNLHKDMVTLTDYVLLRTAAGEPHLVRTDLSGGAATHPTRGIGAFAQITDLQIVDDKSPGRVEFTDSWADLPNSAGYQTDAAYRPQEILSTHLADANIRAIRNVQHGPITGLPLKFTIATGDMVDNVQYNETRWYIGLLDGAAIRAESGTVGDEATVHHSFPLPEGQHRPGYWSSEGLTDQFGDIDNYRATYGFPVIPGLLPAARQPYRATGLGMPWYAAMGNHDGEIQGNYPLDPAFVESFPLLADLPDLRPVFTGSSKPYNTLYQFDASNPPDQIAPFVNSFVYDPVAADSDRRVLSRSDFCAEHNATSALPEGHGLGGGSTYYAIPADAGDLIQYITIDTVCYDGGASGVIPQAQYQWLESQLRANSSFYYDVNRAPVLRSGIQDKLFVIFAHHTIDSTVTNDTDPFGTYYHARDIETLLLRYPNVVLYVCGHTHENSIRPHSRGATTGLGSNVPGSGGFWEVTTASHIDWPNQSRIFELATSIDVLSIYTTIVDMEADVSYGGDLSSPRSLASLGRELAVNDPTERPRKRRGEDGYQRNALLTVAAPFQLPGDALWGSPIAAACHIGSGGKMELFGVNAGDVFYSRAQTDTGGDAWSDWLGWNDGTRLRAIAAESDASGNLMVAGINGGSDVFVRSQTSPSGGAWAPGWTWLGNAAATSIAVGRNADGHMEIFVVAGGGDIWHRWQQSAGGQWIPSWSTGFGSPGRVFTQVATALNVDGRLALFATSVDGEVWTRAEILTGGWTDWTALNVKSTAPVNKIAAAVNADGRIEIFCIAHDRRVYHNFQITQGSNIWAEGFWLDDGASRMSQVAAARDNAAGTLSVFAIDHQGAIWRRHQTQPNAMTYTPWTQVDGTLRQDVVQPNSASVATPPPTAVVVPDVTGGDLSTAENAISTRRLTWNATGRYSSYDVNQVLSQNPGGGTPVPAGSTVSLTYSVGPNPNPGGGSGGGGTQGGGNGSDNPHQPF
jgi:metallophosphoesterase (TIGR03767 family)